MAPGAHSGPLGPQIRPPRFLAFVVATLVLLPFAALLLPFELALRSQAAVVLALLGALVMASLASLRERWKVVSAVPNLVKLGLALYTAGALYGLFVGWAVGNPTRYVASQTMSLLFLPMAGVVFLLDGRIRAVSIYHGLFIGSGLALLIVGVVLGAHPETVWTAWGDLALALPGGADVRTLTPLLVLMAAAWRLQSRDWRAATFLVMAGAALLASGSRAAWFWGTAALVGLLLAFGGARLRVAGLTLFLLLPGLALGVFLVSDRLGTDLTEELSRSAASRGSAGASTARREADLPDSGRSFVVSPSAPGQGITLPPITLPASSRYLEVHLEAKGAETGRSVLRFELLDSLARSVHRRHYVLPSEREWSTWQLRIEIPAEGSALVLMLWSEGDLAEVRGLSVRALGSAHAALLRAYRDRLGSILGSARSRGIDRTGAYRARELDAIRKAWCDSPWRQRLLGHGLGATFPFAAAGWDEEGDPTLQEETSYIHNFYAFLGFKLGVAGLLPLTGLGLIVAWNVGAARGLTADHPSFWFLAGSATAWIAYLGLSLTSPEIYNFRMAPLWGALLAACALEAIEGTSDGGLPDASPDHTQPSASNRRDE